MRVGDRGVFAAAAVAVAFAVAILSPRWWRRLRDLMRNWGMPLCYFREDGRLSMIKGIVYVGIRIH